MLLRRHENRRKNQEAEKSLDNKVKSIEEMTVEELIAYSDEKGIDIGKSTSQDGILKKIKDAEQVDSDEDTDSDEEE